MKLLIIEDDPAIRSLLERIFEEEGHSFESAADGEEGLYLLETGVFDAVVLDWMLPGLSGVELLERARRRKIDTPVLLLTARGEIDDKLTGFRGGADDYLVKPFSIDELLARLEALYRRSLGSGSNLLEAGDLTLDLGRRSVHLSGREVALQRKEYELLLFLMKHKNTPVSKSMIEEQLWSGEEFLQSNVIEVTIYNLRRKIGKERIRTNRGLGYVLEA